MRLEGIGAHGAKPKAHVLDNASAVEKAPNSNVASTTTCADLNAVSDDKTPSVGVSADRTLMSPADASAAGSTNTLVAVEAIKVKSEVCCEMNATPTGRPRPTENRSSGRGENLPIANPDALRQMSVVVPSERDTGEERMVGHGPGGVGTLPSSRYRIQPIRLGEKSQLKISTKFLHVLAMSLRSSQEA